ncbi:MAG: nitrile hydratase subunit beta, partial [Pseudomonadota bacterium]
GGKQGFGPIIVTEDGPAFPETWEGRAYGLVQSVGDPDSTIDWFRHIVELLPPAAYLTEPYFQKWQYVQIIELIQAGKLSMDEVLSGQASEPGNPASARSLEKVIAIIHDKNHSFERKIDAAPAFALNQRVRTKRRMTAGHTRLPAYARNSFGDVIAHHGSHALPDAGARGEERGEHLYTVRFMASELWGDDAKPNDEVTLDLWESYLVPA